MLWTTIELAASHVFLLCVIKMLRKKSWTVFELSVMVTAIKIVETAHIYRQTEKGNS